MQVWFALQGFVTAVHYHPCNLLLWCCKVCCSLISISLYNAAVCLYCLKIKQVGLVFHEYYVCYSIYVFQMYGHAAFLT